MTTKNTIALVPLNGELRTSYIAGGRTSNPDGSLPAWSKLLTVKQAGGGAVWMASPATARDLVLLDDKCRSLGGEGISLTDVYRKRAGQVELRERYLAWRAAGKPAPGTPAFKRGMATAFARPPDQSYHQAGMAVDIEEDRLYFDRPSGKVTGNAALALFWAVAGDYGFTPVIAHPDVEQSESWHFDHLGPMKKIIDLARSHAHGDAYGYAAEAACALAGTHGGQNSMGRYVQARIALAGGWPGTLDGILGSMAKSAARSLGIIAAWPEGAPQDAIASALITSLDEKRLGLDDLAAL